MSDPFLTALEQHGYFRGLDGARAQELREEFSREGWMGIFAESHRFFPADAEDLAEGGIGRFLEEAAPFLAAQGVALPEVEDDFTDDGYTVRVGGTAYRIYDAAELERESSGEELGLLWGLSMTRGFRIVDRLLAAAGSRERLYAVNGGNDLFGFFLTPELFRVITSHPDASPEGGPYEPTEDYQAFGQPHDR